MPGRFRLGRTPPRILRNTDGDSYAIEATAPPSLPDDFDPGHGGAVSFEYDDGNGLWITSGESPFDQGFLGCICPQE
jgi:hypothetical protein